MKRVFLVIMLFSALSANAQVRFGLKGGIDLTSVKFDKDIIDVDNITGFHIGPVMDVNFKPSHFGLDIGLLYARKGFEVKNREAIKNDFLEVPVHLKWTAKTPVVKPYLAFGPYFGFRIGGDKNWEIEHLFNDVKGQIETRSFSGGLNFIAGLELFNTLQLGLNYGWALTDDYKTFDVNDVKWSGKAHTWSLTAALFF
ncbi:MAG: PorT family protein [Tannerella sp.]|nr:PorT family protein [Tannerella sp.]